MFLTPSPTLLFLFQMFKKPHNNTNCLGCDLIVLALFPFVSTLNRLVSVDLLQEKISAFQWVSLRCTLNQQLIELNCN